VRYFVTVAGEELELEVERRADGGYHVRNADGRQLAVSSLAEHAGVHTLLVAGHVLEAQPRDCEVKFARERFTIRAESERERASARPAGGDTRGSREVIAPMPGRILTVACTPGQAVQKGTPLIVMEAMKMQNELSAKADHVVRAVHVTSGDSVERGALLIELE
jgi:glutaconyl-CoA/methylmalonyl-CoA decarboxylase subunit gamma